MENKNTIEIDVKDFVNKYSKFNTATAKESYLKTAVKFVDYMNFEIVEVLCDQILVNSCMDKNGNVKVNTCKKYLMYIYTIFDQYTNIAVHSDKWLEEFNLLSKVGLVEAVCQLMPENLITTLDSVLFTLYRTMSLDQIIFIGAYALVAYPLYLLTNKFGGVFLDKTMFAPREFKDE